MMKLSITFCFTAALLITSGQLPAQNDTPVSEKTALSSKDFKRKNNIFFYWGYNRSAYTKSDIHFLGEGYDFSISDVEAIDQPTKTFSTYVHPTSFSIPQYNYRLGYFISDKYFISLGEDHMKYAIKKQTTHITGTISSGANAGTYYNTEVLVGEDAQHQHGEEEESSAHPHVTDSLPKGFVTGYEHCDGLNDVSFEFGRIEQLWVSKNSKHSLTMSGAIGTGMVVPDTEAEVLEHQPYHNQDKKTYHLAGYSLSANIGIQLDFFNNFFLQTKVKGGYINLPDINTTIEGGKASQHFSFIEPMLVVGFSRSLTLKNK